MRIYREGLIPTGCTEVRALKEQQTVNEPGLGHVGTQSLTHLYGNLLSPHLDIHPLVYLLSKNLFDLILIHSFSSICDFRICGEGHINTQIFWILSAPRKNFKQLQSLQNS